MKILITGICGFVGSTLANALLDLDPSLTVVGLDNFIRPGSDQNRHQLKSRGVRLYHGDIRSASDLECLPAVDWVLDAAANPSVLAGVDGSSSSRQLVEHNLVGTLNMLELCKRHKAGFILLSTSRVYSIPGIAGLAMKVVDGAFRPDEAASLPPGISASGISEAYSTCAPVSLYGATKLTSEALALEYGETFGFPVWINRCGVLAGAGQFGRPDQGIFAYWINSYLRRRPLKYIGFGGQGHQVRDCLHPRDLCPVLMRQFAASTVPVPPARGVSGRIANFSGGVASAMSLRNLSDWCSARLGAHPVSADATPRPFDIGWMVLDSSHAAAAWGWSPQTPTDQVLTEILAHAEQHPDWLDLSAPF